MTDKKKPEDNTQSPAPNEKPWVPDDLNDDRVGEAQTNHPYEQDPKRRIGQHTGTGEPPIKKP